MTPRLNYTAIRFLLVSQSLTASIIVKRLRAVCGIPPSGYKTQILTGKLLRHKKFEWTKKQIPNNIPILHNKLQSEIHYSRKHSELIKQVGQIKVDLINQVADRLIIDRGNFLNYVFYNLVATTTPLNVRLIPNSEERLNEPGIYLKVEPTTTAVDLISDFKKIQKPRDYFYEIVYGAKSRKKSTGWNTKIEIEDYIKMESKIKEYYQDRETSTEDTRETYEHIVRYALNELADEDLPNNLTPQKEEAENNKRRKILETRYYDITARYNLPTLQDLSDFLRLIPNN